MDEDKFSALWLSYSSISDFIVCPRAYYYANIYKNPRTGRKVTIMKPPLALGQVIHATLESLSILPTNQRFKKPLIKKYEESWEKISGKKGGFKSNNEEKEFKDRGAAIIEKIRDRKTTKNKKD